MLWRGAGYIGRKVLKIELPEKRKRGRPQKGYMDVVERC